MPLETGVTNISLLNSSNPAEGDNARQGDDHIRLIKSAIKATFPNVTGVVTASHTDLNGIVASITSQISALRDELQNDYEAKIAAAEAAAKASREIKVGGTYITFSEANPNAELGYGTWSKVSGGRAIVSTGSNGQSVWSTRQTRGTETVTLSEAQMPRHAHLQGNQSGVTGVSGEHRHTRNGGGEFLSTSGGEYGNGNRTGGTGINFTGSTFTSIDGNHQHTVTVGGGATDLRGSGQAHENVQPSLAVNVWERTA